MQSGFQKGAASALPADENETIFQPGGTASPTDGEAAPPRRAVLGPLPPGAVLNNIYEVRRFIARGGMGEVYEGVNVNTDERVAIKVMLPHLAADPKVQAMFRKEARILTELAHPALVRYRVLAHEPHLDVFYIVTEFIDGRPLSELLGTLRPSAGELKALMRRLAEGLATAHAHSAVHRDISPDNVLVPLDRLDLAKIIDFGIARENSLTHQTVVGDGFAGKLGYVAPEQLGDFGRRIGPWTDVYGLGLVGLALAAQRAPDMGVTLVDAVDRRREGVDLAPLPAALQPVFRKMLAPDPSDRFQSMAEVIAALDALDRPQADKPPAAPPEAVADVAPPATEPDEPTDAPTRSSRAWLFGGLALAALVSLGVGAALASRPVSKAGPLASVVPISPAAADSSIPEAVPLAPEAEPPPQAAEPVIAATAPAATPLAKARPKPAPTPQPPPGAPSLSPAPPAPSAAAAAPAAPAAAPAATAVAAAEAEASPVEAEPGVEACWQATGGSWSYLGYMSKATCTAQVFNSCSVIHGRWGKTQLRRYDGRLQSKGSGLLASWRGVGASNCPATGGAE